MQGNEQVFQFDRMLQLEEDEAKKERVEAFSMFHDTCGDVHANDACKDVQDKFDKRRKLDIGTWEGCEVRRTVAWTDDDWARPDPLLKRKAEQ